MIRTDDGLVYYDFKPINAPMAEDGQTIIVTYRVGISNSGVQNLSDDEIRIFADKIIEGGDYLEDVWDNKTGVTFKLGSGEALPGIERAIKGISNGSTRRVIVPPDLAFGKRGVPDRVPPNAYLVFEIYLMQIE